MEDSAKQEELVGLEGWLMLFIVGLIYQLVSSFPTIAEFERMDFAKLEHLIRAIAFSANLIGALGSLILIFAKSRFCPKFVIGYLAILVVSNVGYAAVLKSGSGGSLAAKMALAASTFKSVVWNLYFLTSRRVRNTFHGLPVTSGGERIVGHEDSMQ